MQRKPFKPPRRLFYMHAGKWLAIERGALEVVAAPEAAPPPVEVIPFRRRFPLEDRLSKNDRHALMMFRSSLPQMSVTNGGSR